MSSIYSYPSELLHKKWGNRMIIAPSASKVTHDSKVHGANMGPSGANRTQVGPMLAPMNFAIWDLQDMGKSIITHAVTTNTT